MTKDLVPISALPPAAGVGPGDLFMIVQDGQTKVATVGLMVTQVGLFSAIGSLPIPSGTDIIRTTGYATKGVGSAFYVSTAKTGRTAYRTQSSNGRWFEYLPDSAGADLQAFGADPAGAADCSAALTAALAFVQERVTEKQVGGLRIRFRPGTYLFASTINLKQTVILEGDSVGQAGGQASRLLFARGIHGVILNRHNTLGTGLQTPATTGADASVLRNLCLQGQGGGGHGVWLRCRAHLENVHIDNFGGDGLHIDATAGGGGSAEGNANNWRAEVMRITRCGGHGLFVRGADANAGSATAIDCSANGGWGIYDSSFLGNSYLACHTASNAAGPYRTSNANARNLFLGCYSESGQPGSVLVSPTMVVGGLHGAGFDPSSTATILDAALGGVLSVGRGVQDSARGSVARLGGNAANGDVLSVTRATDAPNSVRMHWKDGNLRWDYANSDATVTMSITGQATPNTFGRSVTQPNKMSVDNFFIGRGDNARQHTTSAAAPTSGEWARGDIVWNMTPTAAGNVGWICVTGGTPGTWKTFGAIDA
ncbi:MAG: hypothetical protein JWP50_1279 [Phenylobacterium sp.]|nr:hypothetical protein [Phenylobacterium sp.]